MGHEELLNFNLGANIFQLLLEGLGIGLRDGFLDGLRRAIDQVLGLLEPKARGGTNNLDRLDFILAGVVGCRCQKPLAELEMQILEVRRSRARRFDRVSPFIHPAINL